MALSLLSQLQKKGIVEEHKLFPTRKSTSLIGLERENSLHYYNYLGHFFFGHLLILYLPFINLVLPLTPSILLSASSTLKEFT